ncbi:MAG: CRISPR-associated primase-polymerase type A1 [Thermodesulfobacteriota bacterium]
MVTAVGKESVAVSFLLRKAERAFLEGDEEAAATILDRVRSHTPASAHEWVACAQLNETLGRPDLALEDYGRALVSEPGNPTVHLRRARIFLEINQSAEARKEIRFGLIAGLQEEDIRRELGPLLTRLDPPSDPDPSEIDRAFYQSRGRRKAVERFIELFQGRPGAYARQWFDPKEGKSGYFPVLEPMTPEVVEAHLQGKITIGQYLLDAKAMVHFAALDLDVGKEAIARVPVDAAYRQKLADSMRALMGRLSAVSSELGMPLLFERSGHKGVHGWCFFEGSVPAWAARAVLMAIREAVSRPPLGINVEVFPKQVELSKKGYGNLIKLPLGVHRVSGKRSVFLDEQGRPVPNSLDYLLEIKRIPADLVISLAQKLQAAHKGQVLQMPEKTRPVPEPPRTDSGFTTVGGPNRDARETYRLVLEKCAMMRYLVRKARDFRHLSFDERKVVLGVLGHLPGGERLVHHVISRCADYDPQITAHFISRMPAAPLGCRSIRRRLFYLEQTRCRCVFQLGGKAYSTPLLHVSPRETRR